ncbi:MAG TPA: 30S ribosomal protein S5 [Thermoplasmata archaeon]|nr:30S ribosomal protein S5 [Thermoplasmata archaeon]HUJ77605.1 30S ribosomal protein S5 [Thermoplasmata archaeon]
MPPPSGGGGPGAGPGPAPPPWVPRTELGRRVQSGEFTTMAQALRSGLPLREAQIVDALLPGLHDEVLDVNMVQRMTDSGRRFKFAVTVVVGNGDGFVGLGRAKGKEVGPTIRRAIDRAKLEMVEVLRGCGSWECGCGRSHTVPFAVRGRSGSVVVTFKPAPRGVGLAVGDVAKPILRFAGITDAWGTTDGHTKTTVNYAKAAFTALLALSRLKVPAADADRLKIVRGAVGASILPPKEEGAPPRGGRGGRRGGPPGRRPGGPPGRRPPPRR